MKSKLLTLGLFALGGVLGAEGIYAQGMDQQSVVAPTVTPVLEIKSAGEVSWLCGGVGQEESAFLKTRARDFDLALTFATRQGEYLADVKVAIDDAKGNAVLRTTCDGPLMLVNLPQGGRYVVRSEANGVSRERTAQIAGSKTAQRSASSSPLRMVMTWPEANTEDATRSTGSGASAGDAGAGLRPK